MIKKIVNLLLVITILTFGVFTANSIYIAGLIETASNSSPKFGTFNNSVKKLHEPTIRLMTEEGRFFCTGIVIDDNYALTAAHCIKNPFGISKSQMLIVSEDGTNTDIIAIPVALDSYRDIGFIKGDFKSFKSASVDFTGSRIKIGMVMLSCGFPAGQLVKYCTPLILIGNYYFQFRTIGAPIYKGMSGGPVIDPTDDTVIGINSAVLESSIIIAPIVGALESVGLQ